jgi:hypothetical protein
MKLSVVLFTFAVAFTTGQLAARAETLQIPEGGKAVPVGKDRVVYGELPEGWVVSGDRRSVRPPESASIAIRTVQATIAASPAGCGRQQSSLVLIATGPLPELDAASVSFSPDEGRLELKGTHLEGIQIVWQAGNHRGQETCLAATPMGKIQQCVLPLPRKLPVDAVLRWLPTHAKDAMPSRALAPTGKARLRLRG